MTASAAEFAQLQRDVQILKDIEAIKRLKHAYFRAIDSADLDLLATLLHADIDTHFIGGGYEWRLTGRAAYLEAVAQGFHSEVACQHNGHHPEIDIEDEQQARGIWYLHDIFYDLKTRKLTQGTAFYHDRYIKEDGRWWIKATSYQRHYEMVEENVTLPNFTVRYLVNHGRKL